MSCWISDTKDRDTEGSAISLHGLLKGHFRYGMSFQEARGDVLLSPVNREESNVNKKADSHSRGSIYMAIG